MLEILARNWWVLVVRGLCGIAFGAMALAWPGITLGVLVLMYGCYAMVDGVFALGAILTGKAPASSWWAVLFEGVTGIGAGLVTFFYPIVTEFVLIYLIAVWAIVTGVLEIIFALRLRKHIPNEIFLILAGLLSIGVGILLAAQPGAAAGAIVLTIGIYAILFGVLFCILGLRLRGAAHQGVGTGGLGTAAPKA